MPPFTPAILELLEELILAEPGLKEYRLYQRLKERGIPYFLEADLHDELELFRLHFLLFHHLYLLKDRLRKEGRGDLAVHWSEIRILPHPGPMQEGLTEHDPLREYYLDVEAAQGVTREEVQGMIRGFWSDYACWQARPEAHAILGLKGGESEEEILKAYRRLAKEHHPDRGGDPEEFQKLAQAKKTLLG